MEIKIAPNKHGYLVTGKLPSHDIEEQSVFRTVEEVIHAFRRAGLDAETLSRMGRHLERGDEFSLHHASLATEHLFPQRKAS